MDDFEKQMRDVTPCTLCGCETNGLRHDDRCPAYYRPAIVALLKAADANARRETSEIISAIQILLRVHVKRDRENIDLPIVVMGAIPEYDYHGYSNAWVLLWEKFDPQKRAEAEKKAKS